MYICMYIYIHICVYHIHICIYVYVKRAMERPGEHRPSRSHLHCGALQGYLAHKKLSPPWVTLQPIPSDEATT